MVDCFTVNLRFVFFSGSSDDKTASYCVPPDAKLMVQCPLPPANFTQGFACEHDKTLPCLFNVTADPCEQHDLSATFPDVLKALTTRLQQFRDAAVDSNAAHPNPDGPKCPYTTTDLNVKTTMPCPDNGTKPHPPVPPPSPSPPPVQGQFALEQKTAFGDVKTAQARCLLLNAGAGGLRMGDCGTGPRANSIIWSTGAAAAAASTAVVKYGTSCLKVYEESVRDGNSSDCGSWSQLHVGICRGDSNNFTFDAASGTLKSNMCNLKCVTSNADGAVELALCTAPNAAGWGERVQIDKK